MESGLEVVNLAGRHAGSSCYIPQFTHHRDNEGQSDNRQCILWYSVYAVLGLFSTRIIRFSDCYVFRVPSQS